MANLKPPGSLFQLPALHSLSKLADHSPTIVIDSREQRPLPFERLKTQPGSLITGDYSVAGMETQIAIERKSIEDLAGCCAGQNRERFRARASSPTRLPIQAAPDCWK